MQYNVALFLPLQSKMFHIAQIPRIHTCLHCIVRTEIQQISSGEINAFSNKYRNNVIQCLYIQFYFRLNISIVSINFLQLLPATAFYYEMYLFINVSEKKIFNCYL